MIKIPRLVAFEDGKAICAGIAAQKYTHTKIMDLPTDHWDFLGPIEVAGKTESQILAEIKLLTSKGKNE